MPFLWTFCLYRYHTLLKMRKIANWNLLWYKRFHLLRRAFFTLDLSTCCNIYRLVCCKLQSRVGVFASNFGKTVKTYAPLNQSFRISRIIVVFFLFFEKNVEGIRLLENFNWIQSIQARNVLQIQSRASLGKTPGKLIRFFPFHHNGLYSVIQ